METMDNNHLPPAHPVFTEDHFETTSAQTEITRWPHHFLVKKPMLILQGLKARSDAASKVRRNPQALVRGSMEGMPSSELLPSTPQAPPPAAGVQGQVEIFAETFVALPVLPTKQCLKVKPTAEKQPSVSSIET